MGGNSFSQVWQVIHIYANLLLPEIKLCVCKWHPTVIFFWTDPLIAFKRSPFKVLIKIHLSYRSTDGLQSYNICCPTGHRNALIFLYFFILLLSNMMLQLHFIICYILFWKRQWSFCIMISYAELHRERTFFWWLFIWEYLFFLICLVYSHGSIQQIFVDFTWPLTYYQAKRLLGEGNALSGSIPRLHRLQPSPNIHTDWKQRKETFFF